MLHTRLFFETVSTVRDDPILAEVASERDRDEIQDEEASRQDLTRKRSI